MEMNSSEIQALIPNRYPLFYMDGVEEIETDKSISAIKNVTVDESFVNSYLPGKFIMPATLILESLAQAASIFILKSPKFKNKTAYLGGIPKSEILQDVKAGDQLQLKVELKKQRQNIGLVDCVALVDEQPVVTAELMFIVEDVE
ncbi:3-hydroxyacyl-ACP dehydratase FabZ [Bombilactobacillus thymidiniphilus]|uniref:3-hydroxyacyl-ACP dehydratase FabZ n=1 Tax=Bombilactobacillus thymidiniphilus TaxID=2923363 RepID=A0ABY4PF97_9LACO|nr:3-hydroxyacyl-ACP dehydratase FabZ [Bombilactobacillus thymidiniphilus]UQS84232.1 3-hydroxyacyl-ACP dehydratase FabZ [Bombilactobacillus thymidiniphilus]